MKKMRALLVNPYIYDFAAYNFWSMPIGLLSMGSVLRQNGIDVSLIDCLRVVESRRKGDGRAPFIKEKAEKPPGLTGIRKNLRRYGLSIEAVRQELLSMEPPDLVLITSVMTYWYRGAKEVSETIREVFPNSKIALGGIYPTLCYEHACENFDAADLIVRNNDIERFYRFVEEDMHVPMRFRPDVYDMEEMPYPAFDLYKSIPYVPIVTSYGCMFRCTYCATRYLHPRIVRRRPDSVINEIHYWHKQGVERFVLYDDNFLYRRNLYANPLLGKIASLPFPVKIFNPNALNASLIDDRTALLLRGAGFQEIRLGLETIDRATQQATGGKVTIARFERAVDSLARAGFAPETIHVYILAGLPLQRWQEVKDAIDYLSGLQVTVDIAEYTPIPHSPMFEEFAVMARYPVTDDPIFQNNALFPFAWDGFTDEDMARLKVYARNINQARQSA